MICLKNGATKWIFLSLLTTLNFKTGKKWSWLRLKKADRQTTLPRLSNDKQTKLNDFSLFLGSELFEL